MLISRRNCGNVFCKDCCHLRLPIPDQQLYDPVLVCNTCYDLLLESRTRELCSQQLKKPIATASSWDSQSAITERAAEVPRRGVCTDARYLAEESLSLCRETGGEDGQRQLRLIYGWSPHTLEEECGLWWRVFLIESLFDRGLLWTRAPVGPLGSDAQRDVSSSQNYHPPSPLNLTRHWKKYIRL